MSNLLRPDTVQIERKNSGAVGPSGEAAPFTVQLVQAGVPCLIDALPVQSRMGGDVALEVEGVKAIQTKIGMFDGLAFIDIPPGAAAGSTITILGIVYTVSANKRGAFIDIKVEDRITDQDGTRYLVLAIDDFYEVTPLRECRLQKGRSW